MQEYLASRVLLEASRDHGRTADEFWPDKRWWARSGWEVVAEIAAESCEGDPAGQTALIAWLAQSNPAVACDMWQHTGRPALPETLSRQTSDHWLPRMTDPRAEPDPRARASIGRALGRFGLDTRKGVGLRRGIPDIDWVTIPGDQPFIYQYGERLTLPRFRIARYPITNRQYQAFINAGGYTQARWWHGLAWRIEAPAEPRWSEPNSPRERVSWNEAMAFCAWITDRLGDEITLPTEHQWERAARGLDGREYPWGEDYRAGHANCDETAGREVKRHAAAYIGQTTAVGIYPQAKSPEGVLDLAGNVWEWCMNEIDSPERTQGSGNAARALRGGSWINDPVRCRAANRDGAHPDDRHHDVGFRVCCGSLIE